MTDRAATQQWPAMPNYPHQLPPGESWTHTCGICGLCTQRGRAGLVAHQLVVHDGRSFRAPR